ncbi:MAG: integrin alpha [Anaerolineaceae bacterium]|jgi:hypothetical protein|nr:integrin alpha [Anaerolineaceae bacterium]MDD4043301.1 integrin alpha [Anaerolineaceae bacterium]MDD4577199.1 integrin alpha [Anaerolineaceae bacterium]
MPKKKFLRLFLAAGLFFLPFNISSSQVRADSTINSPPATTPGWTFTGEQTANYLGQSWIPVGDVDGDSYDDLIVGAYGYDTPTITNAGRAYLFYGYYTGLDSTPDWVIDGEMTDAYFGYSVAGAGDVNGDGFEDVLVGSHGFDITEPETLNVGKVYLFLGSEGGLEITPAWIFTGSQAGQAVGVKVAGLGDVDDDGFDDFAVGSSGWDGGQTDEGLVYVFYGSADGPADTADWTAESNQTSSNFGASLSGLGDVNGDGFNDLLVGASTYDNGITDEGAAFAWYGSADGFGDPAGPDWMAESNQSTRFFSYFLGNAGDVNDDGYDDVVISSFEYSHPSAAEGVVFLWYGSENGINEGESGNPGNSDWQAESNASGFAFGTVTGIPADINHDGYDDVIVGCQLGTPGIFVYYGSETGPNLGVNGDLTNWDWHVSQPSIPGLTNAFFARQAGSAGDINGDGVDDIAASSHYYYEDSTNALYRAGRIWAYYSSAGVIEGTVTYTGPGASPLIEISAHLSLSGPPEANEFEFGGDLYSLRGLDDDTYYIFAVIDFDGSGGPPDPEDIISFYDPDHDGNPNPVVIASANRVTGIDFEITGSQLFLPMITK